MTKKLLFSLIFVSFCTMMFANPVTINVAQTIATNYYKRYAGNAVTDFTIGDAIETKYGSITTYYTFVFNAGGFVMVAADDAVVPILGYSIDEPFDKNNIPANAQFFFDEMSADIAHVISTQVSNTATIAEWNNIINGNISKSLMAVNPLLVIGTTQITWDQGFPFNAQCPSLTYTGCVATSMAQIMRKWAWPITGTGSHSYTHATYGVQTANFGATTYNWAGMPASITTTNSSVATLMKHCGVAVDMNYGPNASGAYATAVPPALINYFGYQPSAEVKNRSSFPNDQLWLTMIEEELNEGRPVLLTGDNAGQGLVRVTSGVVMDGLHQENVI